MDGGESQFGCCIIIMSFFCVLKLKSHIAQSLPYLYRRRTALKCIRRRIALMCVGGAVMKRSLNWEGEVVAFNSGLRNFKQRKH